MLILVLCSFLLLYALKTHIWLEHTPNQRLIGSSGVTSVTLIVPFRNESNHLNELMNSLKEIIYPSDKLEILMMDDHSTDDGTSIVTNWISEIPFEVSLIHLTNTLGKKAAIAEGVRMAKGELILTTDADCIVGKNWVHSFDQLYRSTGAVFITGPVLLEGSNSFLSNFQKVDQAILMKFTELSVNAHKGNIANGANMAFQKSVFQEEYLSANKSSSGDDVFLLHALKKLHPTKIVFNNDREAVVSASVKNGFRNLIDQRVRWASKSRHFKDFDTLLFGIIVVLANSLVLILLVSYLIGVVTLLPFLLYFSVKLVIDLLFLYRSKQYLILKGSFYYILLYSLCYPFYAIGIALLSLLYKPHWKGRKI